MSRPDLLISFGLVVFLGRALLAFLDHRRIREYVTTRGGVVTDITWASFRSSLPGANRDDTYTVTYQDRDGVTQTARCRTSLFEGVFLSDRTDDPMAMDLQASGRLRADSIRRWRAGPGGPGDDAGRS